jgi:hypothetical protein
MALAIEDLPREVNESKAVDLGDGVMGRVTCVGYNGDVPIYTLSVDGAVLATGPAEFVIAQAAHYRKHRAIKPGLRYRVEEHVTPTPFGDRTDMVVVLVDE